LASVSQLECSGADQVLAASTERPRAPIPHVATIPGGGKLGRCRREACRAVGLVSYRTAQPAATTLRECQVTLLSGGG